MEILISSPNREPPRCLQTSHLILNALLNKLAYIPEFLGHGEGPAGSCVVVRSITDGGWVRSTRKPVSGGKEKY
jgi:hypothetical protein